MLTISNMSWTNKAFTRQQELISILANKLSKLKLSINIKLVGQDIVFNNVDNGDTFLSSVTNKINLKANDARIAKKGRNYLQTKRPTKVQYEGFYKVINDCIDALGLNADVTIITKKKESIVLRHKKQKYDTVPKQKSFPVEM